MPRSRRRRPPTIAAAAASALALVLVACGGDDEGAADAPGDATTTSAPSGAAGGEDGPTATGGTGDAGGACDGLDEAAVAALTGEVVDSGPRGGEPVFGREDGTEFTYTVDGCTFDVAVDGDDDPHVYAVSTGAAPDGIDLFDEFLATRDPADLTPVRELGDEAVVDATFGDQKVELIVRIGDGTALFVSSDPPFGVPVAGRDVLVALAELALEGGEAGEGG